MIGKMWPYILGGIALGLDAYVIAGLLPKIAADLNSTPGAVGLGVTAFTGAYALTGPLLAGAAGRHAAQSLRLTLSIFVIANIASTLACTVEIFIATRLIAGAAAGIYSPLSSAIAASNVPGEHRGRALSLILTGLACGTVFGVPLGLLIAEHSSWRWTFALIATLGALATAGVTLRSKDYIPDIKAPSLTARLSTLGQLTNTLTILVTLLTGIASLGLYTYLVPLLDKLGYGSQQVWLIWIWGIGGTLGTLFIGRIVDATPRPPVLTAIIIVTLGVTFVSMGLNLSLPLTAFSVFLWGLLGWASLAPQQYTLITTNPHDGTTAVAANSSANYLGSALGSLAGAALVDHNASSNTLSFAASGIMILALLLQILRIRIHPSEEKRRRHRKRHA